jgi:hypothetical protein
MNKQKLEDWRETRRGKHCSIHEIKVGETERIRRHDPQDESTDGEPV